MSEAQSLIRATFKGVPNLKEVYRGDGLFCNVKNPQTCKVLIPEGKAVQLMKDFPDEWEFPKIKNRSKFIKDYNDYQNRMIAYAENKKGIKISYSDDRIDEYYPEDSVITINRPKKKKV